MVGAGLTLAATVGLFTFGGHLLDGALGTTPLFLIVGLLLGAIGGFIHLFSVAAPGVLPFGRSKSGGAEGPDGSDPAERESGPRDPQPPPPDPS